MKSQNGISIKQNIWLEEEKKKKKSHLTVIITQGESTYIYGWVLECARPFSDDAPSLAGTVQNNTLQQTSGCTVLFCLLFQRVGCFCETLLNSTSSWCCDITVFISILQLHKLSHLIHSKSILIVLYDNAETPHMHDLYYVTQWRKSFLVLSKEKFVSKHWQMLEFIFVNTHIYLHFMMQSKL